MITYKMHFIRTGRTGAGDERRYVGQSDLPLSEAGVEELRRLRREYEYPRVEMVFTSPLRRTGQTAEILYPDTWAEPLDGLADMGLGRFEGNTLDDLQHDNDFNAWLQNSHENPPPGGEELEAFTERIVGAVGHIFERMMEERMTSVAVVTHGGVIMSLLAGIGLPKQPLHQWFTPNGTGFTLLFTPQMWMRDGSAEIYSHQPIPPSEDSDVYEPDFE